MTKRSGFNISIDKNFIGENKLNPLTPKCVASDVVDPLRNSLIKISNNAKFCVSPKLNSKKRNQTKKEEEAKYFQK